MVLFMFLLVWMLRKCKKREENLEFLIFWATMFLGEEQLLFKQLNDKLHELMLAQLLKLVTNSLFISLFNDITL